MIRKCFLRRIDNNHIINLPNKEDFIIGRNKITCITDLQVSKKQLSCYLNTDKFEVKISWLGSNMSGINGFALKKNNVYNCTHKDRLEVILGKIIYEIIFDPPPTNSNSETNGSSIKTAEKPESSKRKKTEVYDLFARSDKKSCNNFEWERLYDGNLHIMTTRDSVASNKIAAYDLDGTLITTISGRVFPKDTNDWKIAFSEVPSKLKNLVHDGFKIVFFTNQAGIQTGKVIFKDFKTKLERICSKLNVPVQAFVAIGKDINRKPAPGMWNEFLKRNNGEVNMDESFYCGDAAGRPENWAPKTKKDHSISDRLFARNIGLRFVTPEEHFLNQRPAQFNDISFNPKETYHKSLVEPKGKNLISDEQELLLLVGCPGSGKTFVCKKYIIPFGYRWINRDTLGTAAACLNAVENSLIDKSKVVVDNTNIDVKTRKEYILLAKKYNIPVRCAVMTSCHARMLHNNRFRELTDKKHQVISTMLIHSFRKNYEEPTLNEGFTDIIKVNFIPSFEDNELKSLYDMYLLDKYS